MPKTIEEILKDLKEWHQENEKERCFFFCVGTSHDDVELYTQGRKSEIATSIATMACINEEVFEVLNFCLRQARNVRDMMKENND